MQCFILYPDTEKCMEKRGAAEFFKTDFEVCVWISEETLSGVLDIASQMNNDSWRNSKTKFKNFCGN